MSRNATTQTMTVNNIGIFDRVVRFLFAATLLAPAFVGVDTGPLGWLAIPVLASIYPMTTALIGWDPIYYWIGLSSVEVSPRHYDPAETLDALARRYHGISTYTQSDAQISTGSASNSQMDDRAAA